MCKKPWIESSDEQGEKLAEEYKIKVEEARNIIDFILELDKDYLNGDKK